MVILGTVEADSQLNTRCKSAYSASFIKEIVVEHSGQHLRESNS
jgi:hypothetical protein